MRHHLPPNRARGGAKPLCSLSADVPFKPVIHGSSRLARSLRDYLDFLGKSTPQGAIEGWLGDGYFLRLY